MKKSPLQIARQAYQPKMPVALTQHVRFTYHHDGAGRRRAEECPN